MPRRASDYSKALIYKISCKNPEITDCYVGSTVDLTARIQQHLHFCNSPNHKNYSHYVYQVIRRNGGLNNWPIEKVEDYPCSSYEELVNRQKEVFDELGATLNNNVPNRPIGEYNKEYHVKNKDKISEYNKERYEKNKDKMKEYQKTYRDRNIDKIMTQKNTKVDCECGGKYTLSGKARHIRSQKHQNYLKALE